MYILYILIDLERDAIYKSLGGQAHVQTASWPLGRSHVFAAWPAAVVVVCSAVRAGGVAGGVLAGRQGHTTSILFVNMYAHTCWCKHGHKWLHEWCRSTLSTRLNHYSRSLPACLCTASDRPMWCLCGVAAGGAAQPQGPAQRGGHSQPRAHGRRRAAATTRSEDHVNVLYIFKSMREKRRACVTFSHGFRDHAVRCNVISVM